MSALTGEGRDRLAIAVSDALSRSFADVDVRTSVTNGRLMAFLARHGEILSRHYQDEDVILHCRLPRKFLGRIGAEEACISPRVGGPRRCSGDVRNRSC